MARRLKNHSTYGNRPNTKQTEAFILLGFHAVYVGSYYWCCRKTWSHPQGTHKMGPIVCPKCQQTTTNILCITSQKS